MPATVLIKALDYLLDRLFDWIRTQLHQTVSDL